jgi:hypothetical protein
MFAKVVVLVQNKTPVGAKQWRPWVDVLDFINAGSQMLLKYRLQRRVLLTYLP